MDRAADLHGPVCEPRPATVQTPPPSRGFRLRWGLLLVLGGLCGVPAQRTLSAPEKPLCLQPTIEVKKREGVVELSCGGLVRNRFLATFGQNPVGPKLREGDERTPEGRYHISSRVETPRFHRFLGISYPNPEDVRRAETLKITRLGGGIGIHGVKQSLNGLARVWLSAGHAFRLNRLWGPTDGCIGVSNQDIETLYAVARVGTPVLISP